MVCQGYSVTVAQRPSTPLVWVRILLPLPSHSVFIKKVIILEEKEKLEKIQNIIEVIDKITPYMPPVLKDTQFLWLQEDTLYMSCLNEESVFQERLGNVLKEELDFIKDVKFLNRRKSNE